MTGHFTSYETRTNHELATSSGPLLAPQPDGCDAHDAPNLVLVVLGALS